MTLREEDIAVIGMSGRFPGAGNITEFWDNLCEGRETIHYFSDQEMQESGIDPSQWQQSNYVKAKGLIDNVDHFDPNFFGMSLLEAKILDPQHRLFLLCAWEALENAGYALKKANNRVGVFASTGLSLYLLKNLLTYPELLDQVDEYSLLLGNDKDFLATRVSYLLNLQGPSLNIATGCSSSLVCVHYACQSLLNRECDMALAGGVSITVPQNQGYFYKKQMIGSPDGHCYAFDERAQGTVKSNGVGIVLLKSAQAAVRDEDHIYAVIRGSAVNNDGASKVGYTAPSVTQQSAVISEALRLAQVAPEFLEYIETHGTGTLIGDPIEVAALKQAFHSCKPSSSCALASLKSNLGHLDVAAGIASFIKASLAVYHGKIPASINFQNLNPKINLNETPFYINTELKDWQPAHKCRYAGVSAFGIGGTNVHVILQQPPSRIISRIARKNTCHLLQFSAKSSISLIANMKAVATYWDKHPDLDVADVAYTLQESRETMPFRFATAVSSAADLHLQIAKIKPEQITEVKKTSAVVFMFSGQGSQYPGMGAELYDADFDFRVALDECLLALKDYVVQDLKELMLTSKSSDRAVHEILQQTQFAQPALFALEYALAKSYLAKGIQPAALIGHSIGEYTAAVLAGVFTLQDASKLIALRGRLVQSLPKGNMLAVYESADRLAQILPNDLDIALINAPGLTVISGPTVTIAAFADHLKSLAIPSQLLHTSHAFHSRMLDTVLPEFADLILSIKRSIPLLPIASNVTGEWLTKEQALSASYWVEQLRQTVQFSNGIATIEKEYAPLYVEVGPGRTLQGLLYKQGINRAYNSLPVCGETDVDSVVFMTTLAHLWQAGINVVSCNDGMHIPLPSYQWHLERCWIDPVSPTPITPIIAPPVLEQDLRSRMQQLWQLILGIDEVSDEKHFFNLGGTSLTAIALVDRLPTAFKELVNIVHVYQYPKFGDFLNFIESVSSNKEVVTLAPTTPQSNTEEQLYSSMEEL
jgi:acyl transferase domain-containing protein